jgi:hypothetical protein
MIIVKLIGGLGNQLFQYALGRHLAIKNNTELKLDSTGFHTYYKLHKYSLQSLNVIENIATGKEIEKFSATPKGIASKLASKIKGEEGKYRMIIEPGFHFFPEILNAPDNSYLDGYWQTEKYFKEIEGIIRKECTVKNALAGKDLEVSQKMKSTNAVSMHIRRADYVKDTVTQDVLGTISIEYYQSAAAHIAEKFPGPHFFVFSDDHHWVKENIRLNHPVTYVDHNQADKNYEDLRLMSLCRHNVVANSSFSWWGAWLNNNPDKIVIAPRKWFNKYEADTKDLVPENWIRL